jgi:starvation-inducible DNA-binding protein
MLEEITMDTKSVVKIYPAAASLATPTDLNAGQAAAITECINHLIADTLALYMKTKNFHWHLSGPDFKEYHELFDDQASQLLDSVDGLAERVRKIGGTTIRSISHVTALQTIKDDGDEAVPPNEMITRLLSDNQHMVKAQRAAIELCNAQRDVASANLLEGILDDSERRVWFLFEITRINA